MYKLLSIKLLLIFFSIFLNFNIILAQETKKYDQKDIELVKETLTSAIGEINKSLPSLQKGIGSAKKSAFGGKLEGGLRNLLLTAEKELGVLRLLLADIKGADDMLTAKKISTDLRESMSSLDKIIIELEKVYEIRKIASVKNKKLTLATTKASLNAIYEKYNKKIPTKDLSKERAYIRSLEGRLKEYKEMSLRGFRIEDYDPAISMEIFVKVARYNDDFIKVLSLSDEEINLKTEKDLLISKKLLLWYFINVWSNSFGEYDAEKNIIKRRNDLGTVYLGESESVLEKINDRLERKKPKNIDDQSKKTLNSKTKEDVDNLKMEMRKVEKVQKMIKGL